MSKKYFCWLTDIGSHFVTDQWQQNGRLYLTPAILNPHKNGGRFIRRMVAVFTQNVEVS